MSMIFEVLGKEVEETRINLPFQSLSVGLICFLENMLIILYPI